MTYLRSLSILDWLTHLYEAFNPQFHVQGSIANFDLPSILGAREGMRVMKHWVWEALYNLRPGRLDFLTTVLKLTSLLFAFDHSSALKCINQARFNAPCARIPQFIYPEPHGYYVVEDIVSLFDGNQRTCISSGLKFLMCVQYWNLCPSGALSLPQTPSESLASGGLVRFLRLF